MAYRYRELLRDEGIDFYAPVPIANTNIIYSRKLSSMGIDENGSVLILLLPYYFRGEERNISLYAVPRDYHIYFRYLGEKLTEALSTDFPGYIFRHAADNAPIDEVDAAVRAGLGMRGDNGLFISPIAGSYLFIGGIYTDMPSDMFGEFSQITDKKECIHCGACRRACPGNMSDKAVGCLSAITQKKGTLTTAEEELIKKTGSVWGCDSCQSVCPYNKDIPDTKITFFRESRTPCLTPDILDGMSDEEFAERAYSWRKRETVMRNARLMVGKEDENA